MEKLCKNIKTRKEKKIMKKTLLLIAVLFLSVGIYLSGCQQETPVVSGSYISDTVVISSSGTNCVPIIAGQNITAGSICFVDVDTDNNGWDDALQVCYSTIDGWQLSEAHFEIAAGLSGIPVTKKGNPIPGQFTYKSGTISGNEYCFTIPFSVLNMACPGGPYSKYYAAHCVVGKYVNGTLQTETGWGAGVGFSGSNWGMYNQFTLYCDQPPPQGPPPCETAFGKGAGSLATCFICNFEAAPYSLGNCGNGDAGRWGWSNGPYGQGTYSLELWGAAGQCNTANGRLVGTIAVNYSGSTATITYNTTSGFSLDAVHLYVGSDRLHYKTQGQGEYTIAPGQFPYTAENLPVNTTSKQFTINNLSGDIYIVAHAVVCGNY